MPYEAEDEIDWSDGSINIPNLNANTKVDRDPVPEPTINEFSPQPKAATPEKRIGSPQRPISSQTPFVAEQSKKAPQRPSNIKGGRTTHTNVTQKPPSKSRRRPNRHQPSKDELQKFALYQANQKIYEAMFLKTFITHALHPEQLDLDSHLSSPEDILKIEGYLKAVSRNVNQVANKMIWNAHFKATNLLAKDTQATCPFINIDSFQGDLFKGFGPQDSFDIVQRLNQSWHRSYNAAGMVQHSATNYPIATHRSPFDDIQEATAQNLLSTKGLPSGRVIKLIRKRVVLGLVQRDSKVPALRRRVRGIVTSDVPASKTYVSPVYGTGSLSASNTLDPHPPPSDPHPHLSDAHSSLLEVIMARSSSNAPLLIPEEGVSRLETLVAHYNPNATMHDAGPAVNNIQEKEHWSTRLVKDHKRRLTKRRRPRRQPTEQEPQDLNSIIDQAVRRGVLQRPKAKAQRKLHRLARRERLAQSLGATGSLAIQGVAQPSAVDAPLVSATAHYGEAIQSSSPRRDTASPLEATKKRKRSGEGLQKTPRILQSDDTLPPHPSGSTTLELHQVLPDKAYFVKKDANEMPVWRCGIKHALGYYYNAGDRKVCSGCYVNVRPEHNPKKKIMDFYLPSMTRFIQPAPGVVWKPSKDYKKARSSASLSHNSVAKIAYWMAWNAGATEDEARQKGVEAALEHLQPKPKPKPIPEPSPEPEPEPIDLGPHPSGSKTMEHGQDIPECHYWVKKERHEEVAWRCDGGHALGRYYMAGDKKTCPGCGLNKSGLGRREEMDFYMPPGAVVRQEAPDLVNWQPRKLYKTTRDKKKEKKLISHNQICTKTYWEAVEGGMEHGDALEFAIKETDNLLDAKNEQVRARQQGAERVRTFHECGKQGEIKRSKQDEQKVSVNANHDSKEGLGRNSDGGMTISLVPRKRGRDEVDGDSDSEDDEKGDVYEKPGEESEEHAAAEVVDPSSADESSSSSDSE